MSPVHQRLDVYDSALDTIDHLERVARRIPRERQDLRDQLRRASTSIALNLAEGADEFSPAEKIRFYRMARRSASECIAVLDVASRTLDAPPPCSTEREALLRLLSIIHNLIRGVERRKDRTQMAPKARQAPKAPLP